MKSCPKGEYTLYTMPGKSSWKLIINKQTGQWGTEYSEGQDLERINMKVTQTALRPEKFTISFDKTSGFGNAEAGMGQHHRQRGRQREEVTSVGRGLAVMVLVSPVRRTRPNF